MKQSNEKKRRLFDKTAAITTVVCLLPILIGLAVYKDLPEQVAVHWGLDYQPNGWMPKAFAVWVVPVFLAVLNVICHVGSNSDPKREAQSQRLLALVKWLPAALSLILCPIMLLIALGREIPIDTVICCIIGVLFVVVGNYLPKCRQNYTMGIKLPWTLHDEENWNKTHRMAGPLYMACGLVFLFCGFFGWTPIILVVILLAGVIPVVYSFWLSRKRA